MKISGILAVSLLVLTSFAAQAKGSRFGLGVVLGQPTGLSAKYWLSKTRAIDAAAAWDFDHDDSLVFQSTYILYQPKALKLDNVGIDFYYGLGLQAVFHDHDHYHHDHEELQLGPRAPAGLSYIFRKARIQVFGELSLTLFLVESTDVDLGYGLGARYFF